MKIFSRFVQVLLSFAMANEIVSAAEVYFDPKMIEVHSPGVAADLSIFNRGDKAQLPGIYNVEAYVNKQKVKKIALRFINAKEGTLQPVFTPEILKSLGVNTLAFTALQGNDKRELTEPLNVVIPFATAQFTFTTLRLDLSIPQAALVRQAQDYIDPQRWDDGIPVFFTSYNFSGASQRQEQGDDESSQYLNLQNGLNFGAWRLRNYSTYSASSEQHHWDNIESYAERDIKSLEARLLAGQGMTQGDLFNSLQFTGGEFYSDDAMLPNSQRGFAPVVRGEASTNAEVTIKQNGYLIAQRYVAPGSFVIDDLYPSSWSGDLDVIIKEADGSTHKFTQPFSSVPIMQRQGHLKYNAVFGRYRAADSKDKQPLFGELAVIYGASNWITPYAGTRFSDKYLALLSGLGITLSEMGSVSLDVTHARATLYEGERSEGSSWRAQYSKSLAASDTSISIGGYRYSSSGYYDFDEANHRNDDENQWQYDHKRSKFQISVQQALFSAVNFYFSAFQQNYWNSTAQSRNYMAGFNTSIASVNYSLSYSASKLEDGDSDNQLAFNVRVPLNKWLPHSWATYAYTRQKDQGAIQQTGLSGTAFADNRMSYSLQQSLSSDNQNVGTSTYAAYRSKYGNVNAGYYRQGDNVQLSYGLSGGLFIHEKGVTLSQPPGESFALIDASGASGVRVKNIPGVETDWRGFAVIPYLTSYNENRIAIDTKHLPDDVEIVQTAQEVVPTKGALVAVRFKSFQGARALVHLQREDGSPVPFGAGVVADGTSEESIVDDGGIVYLSGLKQGEPTQLSVKWGNAASQQCRAWVTVSSESSGVLSLTVPCH
jgi:outer membrane usher protein